MHLDSRNLCAALLALSLAVVCGTGSSAGPTVAVGAASGGATGGVTVGLGGGPDAAPGTPDAAKINCMNRIHWRSGGSARLVSVIPMDSGMTIVKAAGRLGLRYICFADPDGEVVRVKRDGGFGLF